MQDDFLNERFRAEDILLGGLGFSDEAKIVSLQRTSEGFCGTGEFSGGETFEFESDEELSELEEWALGILVPLLAGDSREEFDSEEAGDGAQKVVA